MNEKKHNAGPLIVAGVLVVLLIVCVVLLVVRVSGKIGDKVDTWQEQQEEKAPTAAPTRKPLATQTKEPTTAPTEAPTATPTEAPLVEDSDYTLKRVGYEVVCKLNDNAFLVWKNDGYGIADGSGTYVLRPQYPYVEYYDEEWVSFSTDENMGYVYDTAGNLLYTYDYWVEGFVSEEGIEYGVWTCYKRGMKIEVILALGDEEYYGARYYNAETGELIFEAVGDYSDIAQHSLPDETGTAVVVQNGDMEIIIHRITKDGVTTDSRWYFDVDVREFYYSDLTSWTSETLSEGWLLTTLGEKEHEWDEETNWVQSFYDVNKFVMMPLPDEYQNTYAHFYRKSKGRYFGISTLTEEQYYGEYPETMYYAICYNNQVLTEELYTWISFTEDYILAGNEQYAHILNYKGEVLKEYLDAASDFVNGKLVVYDANGVYLIDENLEACSGILMTSADYCMPGFVWKGFNGYVILDNTENNE